jgi:hypothetical protein
MTREKRIELIKKIQEKRSSTLICYILGDRPPFNTNIADDAVRILHDHLESIGRKEQIDMFLYTRGGNLMAPFRIVHLIREFCDKFNVIVPYRALSAGTLLSLGANEIIMGKMGELSPVDPTTGHPFNPQDPLNPGQRIPISVEDVTSFMTFARKRASLSEEKDIDIFRILTSSVHPLALGNIERGYGIIRHVAPKLLEMHIKDKEKIKNIVESLTEGKVHEYLIPRSEAKNEIGLNVKIPDEELESLIWSLYSVYEQDMGIREPFDPVALLGDQSSSEFYVEGAYIESIPLCDAFVFRGIINSVGPPRIQVIRQALPTQPTPAPAEAPPVPPTPPPARPTAPQAMLPLIPPQATVTFTFRGWKRITQETRS